MAWQDKDSTLVHVIGAMRLQVIIWITNGWFLQAYGITMGQGIYNLFEIQMVYGFTHQTRIEISPTKYIK